MKLKREREESKERYPQNKKNLFLFHYFESRKLSWTKCNVSLKPNSVR